jgi:hypothetical protein
MGDVFTALPDIIKEASKSNLGISALLIVVLSLLAWSFFRGAPLRYRVAMWFFLFAGAVTFVVATIRASDERQDKLVEQQGAPEISGTVVDARSNASISQAHIMLIGRQESAVSDDNGNFRLAIMQPTNTTTSLRLRVTRVGYQTSESQLITVPIYGLVVPLSPE